MPKTTLTGWSSDIPSIGVEGIKLYGWVNKEEADWIIIQVNKSTRGNFFVSKQVGIPNRWKYTKILRTFNDKAIAKQFAIDYMERHPSRKTSTIPHLNPKGTGKGWHGEPRRHSKAAKKGR